MSWIAQLDFPGPHSLSKLNISSPLILGPLRCPRSWSSVSVVIRENKLNQSRAVNQSETVCGYPAVFSTGQRETYSLQGLSVSSSSKMFDNLKVSEYAQLWTRITGAQSVMYFLCKCGRLSQSYRVFFFKSKYGGMHSETQGLGSEDKGIPGTL